jgi:hypothetical protein
MEVFQATGAKETDRNQATAEATHPTEQHRDTQDATPANATGDTTAPSESDNATRQELKTETVAVVRHDTGNIRFLRKATEGTTAEQATGTTATTGGDITAARILAYQAEHPGAKQAEVAAALGVTVRTIQRKLAAHSKIEDSAS